MLPQIHLNIWLDNMRKRKYRQNLCNYLLPVPYMHLSSFADLHLGKISGFT